MYGGKNTMEINSPFHTHGKLLVRDHVRTGICSGNVPVREVVTLPVNYQ